MYRSAEFGEGRKGNGPPIGGNAWLRAFVRALNTGRIGRDNDVEGGYRGEHLVTQVGRWPGRNRPTQRAGTDRAGNLAGRAGGVDRAGRAGYGHGRYGTARDAVSIKDLKTG